MTKKKKVFFDGTPLIGKYMSGVGKVLQDTLLALDTKEYAKTHDFIIFLPFDERKNAQHLTYDYITVKYLPFPHKFMSLFSRMRIAPPLDLFLGRGVYIFENFRNWNLIASPSVTYIHDVAVEVYPEFLEERNLKFLKKYLKMWVHRADVIVTVSESSKRDIKKFFNVESVVVPNAANGSLFYPRNASEVKQVRERWGIPEEYYLYIGNIEPRKNLENTIEAYSRAANNDETLVLIGGDGWRNEAILEKAADTTKAGKKVIRPDGYVPDEDLPALISGAKALVHFPWYEGSGLPILQAASCGTPVASSNIAPLREVTEGFEDRVAFADPGDVNAVSNAIQKAGALKHLEKIKTPLSWTSSARKLIDIVDSL